MGRASGCSNQDQIDWKPRIDWKPHLCACRLAPLSSFPAEPSPSPSAPALCAQAKPTHLPNGQSTGHDVATQQVDQVSGGSQARGDRALDPWREEGEEAGRAQAEVIAALGTPQVQALGLVELEPNSVPDPPEPLPRSHGLTPPGCGAIPTVPLTRGELPALSPSLGEADTPRESEASKGPGRDQSPLVMETGMTLPRGVVAERLGWSESREPVGPEVQTDQLGYQICLLQKILDLQ